MTKIAIMLGSTRTGRAGERVAQWVLEQAQKRGDADYDLIDLAEVDLPQIDEPFPPAMGRYTHPHTRQWATTVAAYDGYVLVTPEYNHSFPGVLKNALDRVYAEWNNKAVGLVSYGFDGGVRAVEALRPVLGALQLARGHSAQRSRSIAPGDATQRRYWSCGVPGPRGAAPSVGDPPP
ncbi:NADPH-dependent FMN reductase [Streptomyces sp. NPDC054765]